MYNKGQRKLATDIKLIKNKKIYLFRKWHELDMKLGFKEHKLRRTIK